MCAVTLVLYSTGRVEHLLPRTFHWKQSRLQRMKLPTPKKPCRRKGKPFGTDSDNATVLNKTAPVTVATGLIGLREWMENHLKTLNWSRWDAPYNSLTQHIIYVFHAMSCNTLHVSVWDYRQVLLTYLRTYSTQQSSSWEANRFSAIQEIPRIL